MEDEFKDTVLDKYVNVFLVSPKLFTLKKNVEVEYWNIEEEYVGWSGCP